ncbi:MAG: hypothetical protein HC895_15640 [Leptolyngbyaceae cyanobacterium SM1_3_5]|nr:hypothetical protein [Leptolyngbyaceae cyanobacterium SM1_3_5]
MFLSQPLSAARLPHLPPQHHRLHNHEEVTTCELVSLPDLDTGSEYVRDRLAAYLRDLVSLGVRGFRIDAAKHIHTNDLAAILDPLHASVEPDPYIYQEVIDPGTEAVRKANITRMATVDRV